MRAVGVVLAVFVILVGAALASVGKLNALIAGICERQELKEAHKQLRSWKSEPDARQFFLMAALELLLESNVDRAVEFHKRGKSLGGNVMPPLAELHLKGQKCGGVSDVYYVAAVITKQMVDLLDSSPYFIQLNRTTTWYESLNTLITLTADSGLHEAAERHWQSAWSLRFKGLNESSYSGEVERGDVLSLLFHGTLMTPAMYSSQEHIDSTRRALEERLSILEQLVSHRQFTLQSLDEFSMATTFYLVYQGRNDKALLTRLHASYAAAYPALQSSVLPVSVRTDPQPLRVGFVSNYFRRHSICKLFCGVVQGLADEPGLEIFVFSSVPLANEDDSTRALRRLGDERDAFHFVHVPKMLVANRMEVVRRDIDVLVYLDVGMEPASAVWATERLAAVQLCLWGHPTTTGMAHMDYFISSEAFHRHGRAQLAQDAYSEQLILQSSTGFAFPQLDLLPAEVFAANAVTDVPIVCRNTEYLDSIQRSLRAGPQTQATAALLGLVAHVRTGGAALLCPQFLPKLHPGMDHVLLMLLKALPQAHLVMLGHDKKAAWRQTLLRRWRRAAGRDVFVALQSRIVWMPALNPSEYMTLLGLGQVMLDPFPFGGGVTALEALTACTPVVTLPPAQHVPQLAAGIVEALFGGRTHEAYGLMVANSTEEYAAMASRFAADQALTRNVRAQICERRGDLFGTTSRNSRLAVKDWAALLPRLHRQVTP